MNQADHAAGQGGRLRKLAFILYVLVKVAIMNKDEQDIRDVVATWLAATRAGDIDTILGLMTDDVVFLRAGQPAMEGKAAFASSLKAALASGPVDASSAIDEVFVAGDLGYCRTRLTVTLHAQHGNTPLARTGHTLSLFRREAGQWKLARDANMLG